MTNASTLSPKALAKVAHPDYRGRKFRIETRATYQMEDYWDGGSRRAAVAVDLATGRVMPSAQAARNPMNGIAHAEFAIPQGVAIVERQWFCGKDCGITVYVAPPATALTSAAPALSEVA